MTDGQVALSIAGTIILIVVTPYSYEHWRYIEWKKMAQKAIEEGKIRPCDFCKDPIVPGDLIGRGTSLDGTQEFVHHAGFHYTLKSKKAFCETGIVASGYWDGEKIVTFQELKAREAEQ